MSVHLPLMMTNFGLCDWADFVFSRIIDARVIGREDGGGGADDWTDFVVHGFALGFRYHVL